ncbi:hypothetical protein DC083_01110 [Ignatzschineria ureiclastica]|uniref:Autotransporter domain-containing protein n=1 Tax=Ignatzschineria ureiclastica TaxID=472582 RepID=A0A2U2AGP2_9GAMM|nr:autotransporter outer membrane beta-barrel domain-containing protein [Ignatzschineria ureiclastica]PWD81823.1 hypothetical protein DC083_01110 [Ignatzschineria ureiclastica]GGZ90749.1 AidA-I adhesin-like protein [Ignatzschineria ureiclastica]
MNRVFKVVWNKSMNRWDVTSEIGSSRKKAKRSTMSKVAVSVIAGALALGGVAMAEVSAQDQALINLTVTKIGDDGTPTIGSGKVEKLEVNDGENGLKFSSQYAAGGVSVANKIDNNTGKITLDEGGDYSLTTKDVDIKKVAFEGDRGLTINSANLNRTISIGEMTGDKIQLTLEGNAAVKNVNDGTSVAQDKQLGTAKLTADVGDTKAPAAAEINISGFNKVETKSITAKGSDTALTFSKNNTVDVKGDITVTEAKADAVKFENINTLNTGALSVAATAKAENALKIENVAKGDIKSISLTGGAQGKIDNTNLEDASNIKIGDVTVGAKDDKAVSSLTAKGKDLTLTMSNVSVKGGVDAAPGSAVVLAELNVGTAAATPIKSLTMGNLDVVDGKAEIYANNLTAKDVTVGGSLAAADKATISSGAISNMADVQSTLTITNAKDATIDSLNLVAGETSKTTTNTENNQDETSSKVTVNAGLGGKATVTDSKLTVNNDVNVKNGGVLDVQGKASGVVLNIKGDLNVDGEFVKDAQVVGVGKVDKDDNLGPASTVTFAGVAPKPLPEGGINEGGTVPQNAVVTANNVSITGGAALEVGKYADLTAKEITVDGHGLKATAEGKPTHTSTLTVGGDGGKDGSDPLHATSTLTAESIAVSNGAQFEVGTAHPEGNTNDEGTNTTTVTVDGDITLTNGAAMTVDKSAMTTKDEVTSLNITADKLVLTNGEVDGKKEGEKVAGDKSTVTLKGVDGDTKKLDLTSINEVVIDGGQIVNLDKAATVNMNAVTFTHADGGVFDVKDLTLNEGESSLAVGLDSAPKAKEVAEVDPAKLSINKLTINGGNTTLKAADLAKVEVAEKADDAKPAITSTFSTKMAGGKEHNAITVKDGGMLTLDGNANFEFVKPEVKPEVKAETEVKPVKPELQLTAGMDHTQAVLKVDSPITVQSGGALAGNGYVTTLNLENGSDLYVGNAFKNANLGNVEGEAEAATRTAEGATYGHLAVDTLKVTRGTANLHFSLAEGGNEADRLTILESADGKAKVFVSPVMSATLTGDAQGNVLLIDASAVANGGADNFNPTLAEPVSRGLYEYTLKPLSQEAPEGLEVAKLGEGPQWFLTSDWSEVEDGGEDTGVNPGPGEDNGNKPQPEPKPEAKPVHKYSVDANAYLANLVTSNRMFALSYEDREYLADGNGLWTSVGGSFGKFKGNITKDQIDSKVNYFTLRIGKDLVSTNEYTAGIMAAYGHASGHSDSNITGRRADNKVDGFALGAYGTYYFDEAGYVDAWAQYVHTRNKVERDGRPTEKYNANGLLASIEVGNAFKLSDTVTVVPQGQITYMGVKAKDHRAIDGVQYGSSRGNVQFRLGATLFANGVMNGGTPYVGVNYFHNTSNNKVKISDSLHKDSHDLSLTGGKNLFQLKVGSDFKIDNHSRIGGEVSHTFGKDSYRDTKVDVNYRYDF